jgi:hypothetical protein
MDQSLFNILAIVIVLSMIIGFGVHTYLNVKSVSKQKSNMKFPPWPAKCPDYWKVGGDNECINDKRLGKCNNGAEGTIDMKFEDDIFKGSEGAKYKCKWAKKCNIPWEGIDSLC